MDFKRTHRKHFTRSEVAAQCALEELFAAGFLTSTVHHAVGAFDSPLLGPEKRIFVFRHLVGRTMVTVDKTDDHWKPTSATVLVCGDYWILDRHRAPIVYWVARVKDHEPLFTELVL